MFLLLHYIDGLKPIWEELSLPNSFIGVELNGVASIPNSNDNWMRILPNNCATFNISNDGSIQNIIIYPCFNRFIEGYSQKNENIYFVSDMNVYEHKINSQNIDTYRLDGLHPSSPAHAHPCVTIDGWIIYITGGYFDFDPLVGVNFFISIDASSNSPERTNGTGLNEARYGHGCLVDGGGSLIVFGGYKTESNFVDNSVFMGMNIYIYLIRF